MRWVRREIMRLLPSIVAASYLLLPSSGLAAPQSGSRPSADSQIKAEVQRRVAGLDLGPNRVTVTVEDGTVTLSGTVPSLWVKQEAITRARKITNVKFVVSDLSVASAESDTKLAGELGDKIRRYPLYSVFDDIEGRVKDGVVTLSGFVT